MKKIPFEYRITLTYVFLGSLWIIFSDNLLYSITDSQLKYQTLSTYKGWFFVFITGVMLLLLIKKEIRRRNILYNQLLEAKKKADESDKLKSAFLSNISHFIRTPMNSILGFIDLLENKNNSPEKHQLFLKYINDRSYMLLQTLNSIIEIAKIQEGQYKVQYGETRLTDILTGIQSTARIESDEKPDVKYKTLIDPATEDIFFTDKNILIHILSSLVSNAINFTQKGEVSLHVKKKDNLIVFYIKDSGRGISEEIQKTLFTNYMQNTGTTYNLGEGAGLGLYLSFRLSQLIGGRLWLESTGPVGSIFGLSIPVNAPVSI